MVICSCGVLQHADQHGHGLGAAVAGLTHDAKTSILGQCTGSPAILKMVLKPMRGPNMVNMIAIVQGDQHIDVKQRAHQTPSASRKRSINSLLTTTPHDLPNRLFLSLGNLFGCKKHVVCNVQGGSHIFSRFFDV
jgi:hypothetical protein